MTFWHNSAYGGYGFVGYAGGELAGCGQCGSSCPCPSCVAAYGYAGSGDEGGVYSPSTPSASSPTGAGSSTVGTLCTYASYGQARIAYRQYKRLASQARSDGNMSLYRRYTLMWKCARNEMVRLRSSDLGWDRAGYLEAGGNPEESIASYSNKQLDAKLRSLVGDYRVQGMESEDRVISRKAGNIGEGWVEAAYMLATLTDPANYDKYTRLRYYYLGYPDVAPSGKGVWKLGKQVTSPFMEAANDPNEIYRLMKEVIATLPSQDNVKKEATRALHWFRDNVLATGKKTRTVKQYQRLTQTRESGDQFATAAFVGYDPKRKKELEEEVRAYNKKVADRKGKKKKKKIWEEKWFVPAVAGTVGIMILFGVGTAVRRKQSKAEAAYGY